MTADLRCLVKKLWISSKYPSLYARQRNYKQEAQLWLTNRTMVVCTVVDVWQDFLSVYVNKKFTYICYRRFVMYNVAE